jgi:hypothetical protein
MTTLIAICGWIGSGKGTVSDILVEHYGYTKISFADSLKDSVAAIFGWPRHLLEGDTVESRQWREQIDPWWAQRLGIKELSPRWVLQHLGTNTLRHHFHQDIWLASFENKLRNIDTPVVVPDCRFTNEIASIHQHQGNIWWIRRRPNPVWFDEAERTKTELRSLMTYKYHTVHVSEWAWVGAKFDHVIENEGSIEDLKLTVGRLLMPL